MNLNREIWEGWTPINFIKEIEPILDMIMAGEAIYPPAKNKSELSKYITDNQPGYKKRIPKVE